MRPARLCQGFFYYQSLLYLCVMQKNTLTTTFYLLLGILLFSCQGNGNALKKSKPDSTIILSKFQKDSLEAVLEKKVLDTVSKLADVKKRRRLIETNSMRNRHLRIWVAEKPETRKFYWIAVGEGYGKKEVTHFNFHVYPDPIRIFFYDIINEREIPLQEWHEQGN